MKSVLLILLVVCCSCYQTAFSAEPRTQQKPKLTLDKRLELIELRLAGMESRVASRYAELDCNTGKYDEFLFTTGSLVFFAACTKIEQYLEGHRITIQIGNPHAFNFSNVRGQLGYGKALWETLTNKVEVSTTTSIRAGTWHTVSVVVNPSIPEQMRNIILEMTAETAGATQ